MISPHPPYCFDRNGKLQRRVTDDSWNNLDAYREQAEYIGGRVLEVVDSLIASSKTPPVIIIQADHGTGTRADSRSVAYSQDDSAMERMPILNAYLVPQDVRNKLYPEISPVNSFRLLLSGLFEDENLQALEDHSFYSWYNDPYRLSDVSTLLRSEQRDGVVRY
ncbi:MAG: hypothetical protein R3C05_23970 [Pirellulaceae bacterium]